MAELVWARRFRAAKAKRSVSKRISFGYSSGLAHDEIGLPLPAGLEAGIKPGRAGERDKLEMILERERGIGVSGRNFSVIIRVG